MCEQDDPLFRRFAPYRVKPVSDWLSQEKGTPHDYSYRVCTYTDLAGPGRGARHHSDGNRIRQ
jgi:hypothetical protein